MQTGFSNWNLLELVRVNAGGENADERFNVALVGTFDHISIDSHIFLKKAHLVFHVRIKSSNLRSHMKHVCRFDKLKKV